MTARHLTLLTSTDWHDYELLDSGNLRKLERFGSFRFIRPEPQAMWRPRLGAEAWNMFPSKEPSTLKSDSDIKFPVKLLFFSIVLQLADKS